MISKLSAFQFLCMSVRDMAKDKIIKYLKIDDRTYKMLENDLASEIAKLKKTFSESTNAGREFMRKTGYLYLEESDQQKDRPRPPLQKPYPKSATLIDLPDPAETTVDKVDLRDAIENRRSRRRYSKTPLTLAELSFLLWSTQGMATTTQGERPISNFRTVPSAGARHALETYLLVNNVAGLQSGLYRFLALEYKLMKMEASADILDRFTEACWNQRIVRISAVTFAWTAIPYRMCWRYGERGYRYLHLDAGHVCQNLYLAAESIDCGVCAVAAYLDEYVDELLQIDGENEFTIYLATAGKKE